MKKAFLLMMLLLSSGYMMAQRKTKPMDLVKEYLSSEGYGYQVVDKKGAIYFKYGGYPFVVYGERLSRLSLGMSFICKDKSCDEFLNALNWKFFSRKEVTVSRWEDSIWVSTEIKLTKRKFFRYLSKLQRAREKEFHEISE